MTDKMKITLILKENKLRLTRKYHLTWAFLAMFPNEQWPDFLFITDNEFNEECILTNNCT